MCSKGVRAYTLQNIKTEWLPVNTLTLKQRWSSTLFNIVSTLIFGCKWKLSRRIFMEVVSAVPNKVEIMSIELCRFNTDEPTLFQRWYWFENESWADVCLSTLFQRWKNKVKTLLMDLLLFTIDGPVLF